MGGRGGEGEEFEELDGEESLLDSGLNELGDTTWTTEVGGVVVGDKKEEGKGGG